MYTSRVVVAESDEFRLVSYGHGAAYYLLPTNPQSKRTVWVEGDDATKLWDEFENLAALPDATTANTLARLWEEYVGTDTVEERWPSVGRFGVDNQLEDDDDQE